MIKLIYTVILLILRTTVFFVGAWLKYTIEIISAEFVLNLTEMVDRVLGQVGSQQ